MTTFTIDFFELSFLAEACIPPRPIARTMFWQNLTKVYWEKMTEDERSRLFEWLQKNPFYLESLEKEEYTQIFHSRFNPDNQYMINTKFKDKEETYRAFKRNDRYWVGHDTYIPDEYILSAEKLHL